MKRAKLNNDKITALYCRLSKDDGTNNESMSIYKGHVKENQERTPCKENAGQVYGYYRPIRLSERRERP